MKKQTLYRILEHMKPYRTSFVLACMAALATVFCTLLCPVLIGRAIDCIVGMGKVDFASVTRYLLYLIVTVLLAAVTQWGMGVSTRKISALAARDMREEAFANLNRTPLQYVDSHAHGDIISRMVNDADLVADGILQGLTQLLPGVCTILGTLCVMAVLNPLIALVVLGATPISIVFARFITKRTTTFFKQQAAAQGKLSGFVNETITGQTVIRAFEGQQRTFAEFDAISDTLFQTGLKSVFYSSVTNPGTRFVNAAIYAAVGVIGAVSVVLGHSSVGQLSCFLTYANQYTKPFNEVTGVLTQLQNALAGAERIFAVTDAPAQTPDAAGAKAPDFCAGRVEVNDVSFRYTPEIPLIDGFNLHVKSGQRVAIVGPTGCGKTTLVNLLMRFYEVTGGNIAVDGMPILQIKRQALRGFYGMVLQETWLKNASIRDNIAYGKPDATMDEIKAAAKASYAHSFIKRLPSGYDTVLDAGGGSLSAGQKQLLCIARCMLCKPDMLILDEATSSIDTRTEMLIQKAFETLMQNHTSFVVAHRLSTIETADVILVMKAGHIVEQGTHMDLLAQNGFYASLYRSQFVVD
ncbi:MAG: ABC transporter ATP-binding protein [Ruthenibacterium sp.]